MTAEQRKQWASETWLLRAILSVLVVSVVTGGIWIGEMQTKVAEIISDLERARVSTASQVNGLKVDHETRLRQLETDIRPIGRLEERLIAQQAQLSRIERLIERQSGGDIARPPYGRNGVP